MRLPADRQIWEIAVVEIVPTNTRCCFRRSAWIMAPFITRDTNCGWRRIRPIGVVRERVPVMTAVASDASSRGRSEWSSS